MPDFSIDWYGTDLFQNVQDRDVLSGAVHKKT